MALSQPGNDLGRPWRGVESCSCSPRGPLGLELIPPVSLVVASSTERRYINMLVSSEPCHRSRVLEDVSTHSPPVFSVQRFLGTQFHPHFLHQGPGGRERDSARLYKPGSWCLFISLARHTVGVQGGGALFKSRFCSS